MTRTIPELAPPVHISAPHQREDVWPPTSDLTYDRPTYMADFQWNRISSLKAWSRVRSRDPTQIAIFVCSKVAAIWLCKSARSQQI
ncbi:hypothetical protein AVEN_174744-1 [Araneus ventricosus]|uniref:Uncharacterized protein n=1 Tax=Araneus ventricosus TaxID=182803 RepID=A0A4Y2BKK2_ARAVE|nr:hypothetical protein AVEN_174744-1 [Araneus ventricosus]